MHSPTSEARLFGISDHAGYTSGSIMPDGVTLQVTDSDDDTISWLDFRTHSKYVYNGVPWAAPILTGVDPVAAGMDGGADVTLRGLGFAKSPFLRCVVQYPDVVPGPSKDSMAIPTTSRYDFDFAPATASAGAKTVLDYDTNFEGWMPSDARHPQNAAARKAEWDAETNKDLRGGVVPPFTKSPDRAEYQAPAYTPNYHDEYIYGFWEVITCKAPAVSLPSNEFTVSASNDGGLTGSSPEPLKYTETALSLDGSSYLTTDIQGQSFSAWFYVTKTPLEVQTILGLSNGLGVFYDSNARDLITGLFFGPQITGRDGAKAFGFLGNVTAVDEWHFAMITVGDAGKVNLYIDGVDTIDYQVPPHLRGLQPHQYRHEVRRVHRRGEGLRLRPLVRAEHGGDVPPGNRKQPGHGRLFQVQQRAGADERRRRSHMRGNVRLRRDRRPLGAAIGGVRQRPAAVRGHQRAQELKVVAPCEGLQLCPFPVAQVRLGGQEGVHDLPGSDHPPS